MHRNKIKPLSLNGDAVGLNSDTLLIIKFSDFKILRVVSRSLFLTLVILALPSIGFIASGLSGSYSIVSNYGSASDSIDLEFLQVLFRNVADEGLLKRDDSALFVSSGSGDLVRNLQMPNFNEIDVVTESDLEQQSSIPDETFDFVFTSSFRATKFVDRVTKIGGVVAVQLTDNALNAFQDLSNYKIVYLRRFNSTVVAMKKTGSLPEFMDSAVGRRLCGVPPEAKKEALKALEGALFEPPRRALASTNKHLVGKTKFLADLLGNSLEGYRRRIFVTVGSLEENRGSLEWFQQNYPKGNQDFELHNLKIMVEEWKAESGVSDWLRKNVREEEFVVMKAEAEAVEEMIEGKTICLVDELFLECVNQWDGRVNKKTKKSKRAYWECLALYGRLRDEGVAVHQWWG
ncbi:uncharacterized protein LOC131163383 [Malania oleifera]|uniref:uncharacterized protein LOC131163383 n=1 Tax=Malania oleifera TaxID=397392 RepID=UPI0025AEA414|nr:uncharacterized protein LOC131163383 [Malania oleifera]